MSRTPSNDMCSVRGIGVADIVSTSTFSRTRLQHLLRFDAEPLLFVDDQQAQILEPRRLFLHEPMRADDHSIDAGLPAAQIVAHSARAVRNATSLDVERDTRPSARGNVRKCCSASTVVGTSTATCRPASIALNAARIATSVLPYPTSPQINRSIGRAFACPP